jgi:LPXTG-motif cell wall-anchored protein
VTQSAPELPRTGAWTGAIMLAGAILLAGGVVLRVRLREPS